MYKQTNDIFICYIRIKDTFLVVFLLLQLWDCVARTIGSKVREIEDLEDYSPLLPEIHYKMSHLGIQICPIVFWFITLNSNQIMLTMQYVGLLISCAFVLVRLKVAHVPYWPSCFHRWLTKRRSDLMFAVNSARSWPR